MKAVHRYSKLYFLWSSWTCMVLITVLNLPVRYAIAGTEYSQDIETANCTTIEVFTASGCPHCARAIDFLQQLRSEYPLLTIHIHNIRTDAQALERFRKINQEAGIEKPGVPTFMICGRISVGFDSADTTGNYIKQQLGLDGGTATVDLEEEIDIPWFDAVSVTSLGLPLFTIVIGLVDGFNPCAMWILLVLLSLLVNLRDRTRLCMIAGSFVFISGAVYFAFMAAWLNLFIIIGISRIIQVSVGLVAVFIGAVHIKDYFAFKKGFSLSIPDVAKPGIYQKMRRVVYAENLPAAVLAVVVLAVLVNLVELACTLGLPALYTQILAARVLEPLQYYAYLLLYNVAYIFDDTLMVTVAVFTLSSRKLQAGGGRWLKLISGIVICAIGALLVGAPGWLF